ncbi:tripartite motif-containing 35 [Pelobates cultripes]|uniref:Tripartite motif-containing 35 n=2 Tax=Pelobates cultripes TaxID=61616 RepID=A0AAD1VNG3_PELCU|nr:tripartite motif-containing 35 [Pelobates cultripes]
MELWMSSTGQHTQWLKWINMKQALERRKEQYASQRQRYEDIMDQNQKQFLTTATFIKNDFQKLHNLLQEQEKNNISDLQVELEQKTNLIDGEVKHLIDAIANLDEQLKELDKELNADDHVILKKSCSQKRRIACIAGKLKPIAKDTLINISHHRGYIKYRACREMLSNIEVVPFTFDINTASPWLGVSEDLTKVSKTGGSIPFETPGRLESVPGILGSRGFCCGSHTWEVSLDNVRSWRVGVVSSTDGHLQLFKQESENKYLFIYKEEGCDGMCRVSDASKIELQLIAPLEIVRVKLDFDEGELSFYDAENEILLYTFYDYFSSKVFPYFNIGTLESHDPAEFLEICSMDLCLQNLPRL